MNSSRNIERIEEKTVENVLDWAITHSGKDALYMDLEKPDGNYFIVIAYSLNEAGKEDLKKLMARDSRLKYFQNLNDSDKAWGSDFPRRPYKKKLE